MSLPIDPLIIVVSRTDVEHLRTAATLATLQGWVELSSNPCELRGQLQLSFHGYDTDRRELWAIPEVRAFVQALDEQFPYWFYLADLRSEFLKVLAFCLCRVTTPTPGATAIHPADFAAFLQRHAAAVSV